MINSLNLRMLQGDPVVHDVRNAQIPELFRGLPVIADKECPDGCRRCIDVCPAGAVKADPLRIDLGACIFCPLCEEACPVNIIKYTNEYKTAADTREKLIITKDTMEISPGQASEKIKNYFGRSLKLRQVSAGGCNGCELELNALSNVNFDMGRYGIEFVASPRHADGIVITGPLTKNMAAATEICYNAVPNPKIIILFGACAISGGIFSQSPEIDRIFLDSRKIDLYIPGSPPHPLTFINGLIDWLDKK